MKTLLTSVKIWLKTVVFNAVFFGIWALWRSDAFEVFLSFVLLIGGLFVTAPLLLFIEKLVRLSMKLPYSIKARIAWLSFSLMVLIMLFYVFVFALFGDHPFETRATFSFTGITSVALLIAILTTRKSLIKINTPNVL